MMWNLKGTEEGKEGLEGDPEGTMPKVTRKNVVRRATKTNGLTLPPWRNIDTLCCSFLLATNIRENLIHRLALHHVKQFVS